MIIYKITNLINGKIYIGQTIGELNKRWSAHCRDNRYNSILTNAIQKYGKENFIVEEIDGANSISELNYLEQHYIYMYNSLKPDGYNLHTGGNNHIASEETRSKMSDSAKKRPKMREETKNKIISSLKGRTPSEETKLKISKSIKGRKHREESLEKM